MSVYELLDSARKSGIIITRDGKIKADCDADKRIIVKILKRIEEVRKTAQRRICFSCEHYVGITGDMMKCAKEGEIGKYWSIKFCRSFSPLCE